MDRYSKVLLTIISLTLTWIAFKDLAFIEHALASNGIVETRVVGIDFNSWDPVPVEVRGKITCE